MRQGAKQDTLAALTTFGNTVSGLGRFLTLQDQLQGKTSAFDTLERDRQHLEKLFPAQAAFLDSLNLASQQGQEALRKFLLDQNQAFEDGTIDVKNLNGSIDDFTTIAGDAAGALNSLGDATNAALGAMLNVPQGFKLGAERFKATLDIEADRLAKVFQGPTLDPRGLGPGGIVLTPDLGGTTRQGVFQPITIEAGAITVIQQPGEDSEDFAERVLRALREKARAQSGDSLGTGRVM